LIHHDDVGTATCPAAMGRAASEWVHAARQPVLMDTTRARRDLAWEPRYTAR
jgi:hypothetical protein